MRSIIFDVDKRPRPSLVTPAKGEFGDCTDETQAQHTDIGSIIARYGGNLAELARWRGTMSFGDQPLNNLEDAIEAFESANEALGNLENHPFASLDEAFAAIKDGTFISKINSPNKEVTKHETSSNQSEEVKSNLSQDGQPAAS